MDIRVEYARLLEICKTDEGFQGVDDSIQVAMNYEKRDNHWYKKTHSSGDSVAGFAIDLKTGEYEIGTKGTDHHKAKFDLLHRLLEMTPDAEADTYDALVVEGRAVYVPDWHFPLILLFLFRGCEKVATRVEEMILGKGIGLPLLTPYIKKHRTIVEML